jgi:hypothetical protein
VGALVASLLKFREKLAVDVGKTPTENEDEVIDDILAELQEEVAEDIIETALEAVLK